MLLDKSIAFANLHYVNTAPQLIMVTKINELRKKKLQSLVDQDGGAKEFCEKRQVETADKPINPDHVKQILKGSRNFGETAARNMEKRAGLPEGYFDDEEMTPETEVFKEDNEFIKQIIKKLQSQPKGSVKINVMKMIETLIEGGEESAAKIEGIHAFVEQKRTEYNAEIEKGSAKKEEQNK